MISYNEIMYIKFNRPKNRHYDDRKVEIKNKLVCYVL